MTKRVYTAQHQVHRAKNEHNASNQLLKQKKLKEKFNKMHKERGYQFPTIKGQQYMHA